MGTTEQAKFMELAEDCVAGNCYWTWSLAVLRAEGSISRCDRLHFESGRRRCCYRQHSRGNQGTCGRFEECRHFCLTQFGSVAVRNSHVSPFENLQADSPPGTG